MLKLYYASGACSLSPHIALRESGLPFEVERVDFASGKKTTTGADFNAINPKGYVPALQLENGEILTEGAVMVQYIADLKPEAELAPRQGSFERVRLQEWLNFIATELHKGMGPLFSQQTPAEYKQLVRDRVKGRFEFVAKNLGDKQFLFGDRFSVVDGYLFYTLRSWQRFLKEELPAGLTDYYKRLAERPSIAKALEVEGLTA